MLPKVSSTAALLFFFSHFQRDISGQSRNIASTTLADKQRLSPDYFSLVYRVQAGQQKQGFFPTEIKEQC